MARLQHLASSAMRPFFLAANTGDLSQSVLDTLLANKSCTITDEDAFGPIVSASCLDGFDFTLLFEEAILTILPLGVALLCAIPGVISLNSTPRKVKRSWLYAFKLLSYSAYIALNAAILAIWSIFDIPTTRLTLATFVSTIVGFTLLLYFSLQSHTRSIRPSTILAVYLSLSSVLDILRTRTIFFILGHHGVSGLFLTSFIVKLVILCLEVTEKRGLILSKWAEQSPVATSGVFNNSLFFWLNGLLYQGYSTQLNVNNLMPLDKEITEASRPNSLLQKWKLADKSGKNALFWTVMWHYKWGMAASIVPRLLHGGLMFSEPYLLERVLDFTSEPEQPNSQRTAYMLTAAYAIVHIGRSLSNALAHNICNRVRTMVRGSLVTLIFRKTLRLNMEASHETDAITLMTADIDRIVDNINSFHDVYIALIEFPLCIWLLFRLLGWPVSFSVIYATASVLAGIPIAAAAGNAQGPWLEAIETRLAVTSKILGSMKSVKMTGLTGAVSKAIRTLRVAEIDASWSHRMWNMLDMGVYYLATFFIPVIGLGIYSAVAKARGGQALTESVAFAALGLFSLQQDPLTALVGVVEEIQTLITSFRRIQEFDMSEERQDSRSIIDSANRPLIDLGSENQGANPTSHLDASLVAEVVGASAGYSDDSKVLKDVSFTITRRKTTMIVGTVGSGKTSLLKLILGEMPVSSGSVKTSFSNAAVCTQKPWITWGTIQSNILGMCKHDKSWYNAVIHSCALNIDFEDLPDGDQTATGTQGSRLSGGQQMRVSLARALFSRKDTMILDDVLTGLDRNTEKAVLEQVFGPDGLLKQYNPTVVLATNSAKHLHYADYIIVLNKDGTIAQQGSAEFVTKNNEYVQRLAGQPLKSGSLDIKPTSDVLEEYGIKDQDLDPDIARATGDLSAYVYYVRMSGVWTFSIYLFLCLLCVVSFRFPALWIQKWTDANVDHPHENLGYWISLLVATAVSAFLCCAISDWMGAMILVPKAALKFHELLLTTTMHAKVSFLTSTAAGSTTNRFSQDLEQIDDDLPKSLEPFVIQFFNTISSAILISAGSGYIAFLVPACVILLYGVQLFYLRTSRQLRYLDIETKAPLFSHFLEVTSGLSSIRAYGWTEEYLERSYGLLDDSQKPYFLLLSVQRWLQLVLDLTVGMIAITLVGIATNIRGGGSAFLGVALFNIIDFGWMLQGTVTAWTEMETAIEAISRVRSYVEHTQLEEADEKATAHVIESWPLEGAIEFNKLFATYDETLDPVLQGIDLSIRSGEKVAICGRTGSGKSSLISALLCMLEITNGAITIDGVDLSTLAREEVRRRLNTVPQQPFFLHGNVRENLDPLHIASDETIIEALKTVHLWDMLEGRDGLDSEVSETLLSSGEQQLFCLARAIVKGGKVVIMDEATSSVDSDTDELMQRTIRDNFAECTIVTIVHKVNTVLDFDRVVVLDQGRVVENGSPKELLATPDSLFKALYESME